MSEAKWEEQRLAIEALAAQKAAAWPEFAAEVGLVHVAWSSEPGPDGTHAVLCNGRFSGSCFVACDDGKPDDVTGELGEASCALAEMVTRPYHRGPPCDACKGADHPGLRSMLAAPIKALAFAHLVQGFAEHDHARFVELTGSADDSGAEPPTSAHPEEE